MLHDMVATKLPTLMNKSRPTARLYYPIQKHVILVTDPLLNCSVCVCLYFLYNIWMHKDCAFSISRRNKQTPPCSTVRSSCLHIVNSYVGDFVYALQSQVIRKANKVNPLVRRHLPLMLCNIKIGFKTNLVGILFYNT